VAVGSVERVGEDAMILGRVKTECTEEVGGGSAMRLRLGHDVEQTTIRGPSAGALDQRPADALAAMRMRDHEGDDVRERAGEQRDRNGDMHGPDEAMGCRDRDEHGVIAQGQHAAQSPAHGWRVGVVSELQHQADEVGSIVDRRTAKLERHEGWSVPRKPASGTGLAARAGATVLRFATQSVCSMTTSDTDAKKRQELAAFHRAFSRNIPHNAALGIELLDFDRAPGMASMRLPYSAKLVGNPETGVLHGGAITALVDATCGAAVFLGMQPFRPIATLDLRIDHLAAVPPDQAVVCRAHCVKVTRHAAFARAVAFVDEPGGERDPVATAAATFMIFGGRRSASTHDGARGPRPGEESG
jgi:uncharacterized protein (TIGR00369 family)